MEELLSDYEETPLPGTLFRSFVGSTLLSFGSAAIVQPFEVGKTLLQVQWVPRSPADAEVLSEPDTDDLQTEGDDLSDDNEAEDYFTDLNARPAAPTVDASSRRTHSRDSSGYLMRRSIFDENTKVGPSFSHFMQPEQH